MFPDATRRMERDNDGGDVGDGRRTNGGNDEDLEKRFIGGVGHWFII